MPPVLMRLYYLIIGAFDVSFRHTSCKAAIQFGRHAARSYRRPAPLTDAITFTLISSSAKTRPELTLRLSIIYEVMFRDGQVAILNALQEALRCTPHTIWSKQFSISQVMRQTSF